MSKPQIEYVEVDGVNLRVATQHGKEGLPLLLFNGIGANLELCFPFMEALPEREIVIFDVPGVGRSEMSWRPRRFSGLARLANKLLDRLGYQRVDVIGVSWGGALAQQFARQYADRCRRLILAATSPGAIMVPGRPSALSKIMTPRRYLSPTYMQKAAGDIYGGEARRDPKLMSAHTSRVIAPQFMGYLYQLLAGVGWTSIHWLHRIRQPTLVMAGADDPLVPPANARIIAMLVPNNRLFIVPGGGHLFMLHSLDKVAPVVREFLDSETPLAR
ncbi:MAG TPA: poly(3-hydroxyalkanoate) depolymerase [Steroidobacteraceae bacterium]|nr:poly(3-hydroxyalkanoate) depolymerase [Steroidobacteraceae bacterium]